jgi:hypothetical protein
MTLKQPTSPQIPLAAIIMDGVTQIRAAGTDPGIVTEYAEAMQAGASFPPVVLFHDGDDYYPADGFHRIEAARRAGLTDILADVRPGKRRDAILHAVGANSSHGLRRTQADKRNAIETLLRDPQWTKLSDRKLAELASVDHKSVAKVRRDLIGDVPAGQPNGKTNAQVGNSPPATNGGGSMLDRMLRSVADDALVAECRRRGLEVSPS